MMDLEKAFKYLRPGDMIEDNCFDLIWEVVEAPGTGILMVQNNRFLTAHKFAQDFTLIGAAVPRIEKDLEDE